MTPGRKATVLYVEDDPEYRLAVRSVLTSDGYDVVEAESAEQALSLFSEHKPDIALVDLMMEEVDAGIELVRALRASGEDIPVFLLTSLGDALNQSKDFKGLGIAGILQKPIPAQTLLTLLRSRTG